MFIMQLSANFNFFKLIRFNLHKSVISFKLLLYILISIIFSESVIFSNISFLELIFFCFRSYKVSISILLFLSAKNLSKIIFALKIVVICE